MLHKLLILFGHGFFFFCVKWYTTEYRFNYYYGSHIWFHQLLWSTTGCNQTHFTFFAFFYCLHSIFKINVHLIIAYYFVQCTNLWTHTIKENIPINISYTENIGQKSWFHKSKTTKIPILGFTDSKQFSK